MLHLWKKDSMSSKRVRSSANLSSTSRTGEDISMNAAVTAALTRSFQVAGNDNILNEINMHLVRMDTRLSNIEQSLSSMQSKIDFALESLTPKSATQPETDDFSPKSTFNNEVSGWIRMAMSDLMVDGIKWDFQASFYSLLNIPVTNKIVDFVGSQITAKTGAPWNRTISLRDLKRKVGLVFRRNKSKFYMPSDKKVLLQKISLRKTRRVTKNRRRKQILEHELFGPALREFFGDDVGKLLREQFQSDEESTDSEMGELEKFSKLRVIRPSWRSEKGVEAFEKFDEYDLELRKNARKEKESRQPGRTKVVEVKRKYLDEVPEWAKTEDYY